MRSVSQRYLGANFITPFVISCLFFVTFLLTFQLFRVTKLVINKGVAISTVIELISHIAVSFLPMSIPLAILFASIYSLSKLSSDLEFIAFRSFGHSIFKLFIPYLIVSIIMAMTIFALNVNFIPESKKEFRKIIGELTTRGMLTDIREGQFFTEIPGTTIFASKVKNKGKELGKVFIHMKDKNKNEEKVIFANKGHLFNEKINEGKVLFKLRLIDGNITKIFSQNKDLEKILFQEYIFPINEGNVDYQVSTKDNMKTLEELHQIIFHDHKKGEKKDEDLIKSEIEYWSRINTPLLCIIFTLLGFSLGVQRSRGKSMNSGTLCFLVLMAYYSIFFAGISFARKGMIDSEIAIFVPSILTFFVALKLFRRLEWVS